MAAKDIEKHQFKKGDPRAAAAGRKSRRTKSIKGILEMLMSIPADKIAKMTDEEKKELPKELAKMTGYYSEKLASNNLKRCYDIAPPRVQQYLEAEVEYVLSHLSETDTVLEMGCGYGRVMKQLLSCSEKVLGIDTSRESLHLAMEYLEHNSRGHLIQASAECTGLKDNSIDKVERFMIELAKVQ